MRHFPDDAFKKIDWNTQRDQVPYTAKWQMEGLTLLARHEGVEVFCCPRDSKEVALGVEYLPDEPSITLESDQAWPELRWSLAVGVGLHFTRGIFLEGSQVSYRNRARWVEQAKMWATQFLASHLTSLNFSSLPDFSRSGKHLWTCGGPKEDETPPKGVLPKELKREYRHDLCKATKPNGKRCRGYRKPGTPFCLHHQSQKECLATLDDILAGLRGQL